MAVTGIGTVRHARSLRPALAAPALPTPAQTLAAIPPAAHTSLTDQVIATCMQQVRRAPGNDRAWANLGDTLMQKARETLDLSYYAHAERAYRQALALNPRSDSALIGMAWVNGGRHEFEQSTAWASRALLVNPRSNDAYGLLGDADVEMGNYDAAFEHYQRMLDIRPDISSYSRGAHLLALTGNTRKALWLMAKAVKTGAPYAENTAWCRAQLALILFNMGALVPAEQIARDAYKLSPHNYYVLMALGKIRAARRDYPGAIGYYQQAVAVVPQHDALVALGDLYRLTGRPVEAEQQYRLVETVHRLQKANGVRGDWQVAQFDADHDRNLPEALQMVQEEYRTRPNVYVADTLAWCLYKNGRCAEAKTAIDKALGQKTPEASFLFHAGMISAQLGDRVQGAKYLYQALSLNPNFSPLSAPIAVATLKELGSHPTDAQEASTR